MRARVISAPQSARRAEAGFVLVAVLWILAALATLATIYSSYTVNSAVGSHLADDRVQAEASIRAGVEMAVFRQLALPERARPFRGAFDIRVGRTGVAVRFRSETARIDLNAAPTDLLAGLFTAVGVDSSHAETFADRIVGWRTKAPGSAGAKGDATAQGSADAAKTAAQAGAGTADTAPQASAGAANATAQTGADAPDTTAQTGGAIADTKPQAGASAKEDKLYREQHMPYPPRHAPFEDALELSLLPGIPLAVVERVLPFVTVFSGRPEVDVFTVDPTVLSALPGMTPPILGAVLNARVKDPGDGRTLLGLLGPAKAHATADKSRVFRTTISVEFDNGRRVHAEVVFRLKDQGAEPYELLYWRDDFDGPMQSA
jgi:general secretion pathway protein K